MSNSLRLRPVLRLVLSLAFPLAALGLGALGLQHCSDQSYFPADSGPTDGVPFPADGLAPLPDTYVNPCAPNPPPTVSGKVYAPNGVDPVAGASVHVPLAVSPLPATVTCESCAVKGKFRTHTYAAADGSFTLEVPNGTFLLGLRKGHFRRVIEVTVPECGHLDLPREQTTLPGKHAQWGEFDTVPSIAVVTGAWDHLEKVLDKLGLEEKTVYNGQLWGTGPESLQNLLLNRSLLLSHHVVLINCGTQMGFENLLAEPGPARNNLRAYVREGGRLLATDRSYDYLEQVFPEFIDFEGAEGTAPDAPETIDDAELGSEISSLRATLLDPDLTAWLGLPEIGALLPSGEVELTGFETGWAVARSVNEAQGAKVWVTAPVTWAGGSGVRPLTATYDFRDTDGQGCGRVLYSSYHTHGEAVELLPQERLLEYLMLEIGACGTIE